jgi:hypothetical protein
MHDYGQSALEVLRGLSLGCPTMMIPGLVKDFLASKKVI